MAENIINILEIQPNKVNATLKGRYCLIYGKNKIGKTSWAAKELPNALLCALN